jgi:Metal-dependent hydrolase
MPSTRRKFIQQLTPAALLPMLSSFRHFSLPEADKAKRFHRILSCNIRVALDEDEQKGVGWSARRDICLKIIRSKQPDIICLQEVLKVQADDFRNYFKGYSLLGFDGPEMDAHPTGYHGIAKNPILFSNKRYELLAAGTYWLSETPLVAGSKSWDTARARHANWVRLRERASGKDFRVVNLHLDHVSAEAKIQQAKMVAEESSQYPPDFPQLLAGDFNARHTSRVFHSIREHGWKDTYAAIHGEGEPGFTAHAFQGEQYEKGSKGGKIDFIWCRGAVKPVGTAIIKDQVNGRYPSDHYFLSADVEL